MTTTLDKIFLSELTIEAHESSAEDSRASTVKALEGLEDCSRDVGLTVPRKTDRNSGMCDLGVTDDRGRKVESLMSTSHCGREAVALGDCANIPSSLYMLCARPLALHPYTLTYYPCIPSCMHAHTSQTLHIVERRIITSPCYRIIRN